MGTEEKDLEPATQQPQKEGSPEKEKESPVETSQGQIPETSDPLNTYKWHTGSKGTLNEVKKDEEGGTASSTSTMDRIHKASTNKWSKMQNWRKALSEDTGDKHSSSGKGGDGAKADKGARKNPFRRALSEPPGSLFAALSPSSSSTGSAQAVSSSAAAETSGVSTTDPSQKGGGGAFLKKYLRSVSQKLKRPRLQSRNSTPTILQDLDEAVPTELPRLQWVPHQEVPLWDISNCMLEDGQILISPEEEPTMWTRNRVSSCLSNFSMQNLVDIDTG